MRKALIAALLAVLVVGTGVLLFFALRPVAIPNAGQTPDPVPRLDGRESQPPLPSTSSSDRPSGVAGDTGPNLQHLSIADNGEMIRATRGQCGAVAPIIQISIDDGASWQPVVLGVGVPGEVLDVQGGAEGRLDVVAKMNPQCVVVGVSSFTRGEYWESSEDLLANSTYVSSSDPSMVVVDGNPYPAPCAQASDAVSSGSMTLVLCPRMISITSDPTGSWRPILEGDVLAVGGDDSRGGFVAAVRGTAACGELGIVTLDDADGAETIACLDTAEVGDAVTLASNGNRMFIWGSAGAFRSVDGGLSWAPIG